LSAFEVPRPIAGKRLALGWLRVIDATNEPSEVRKPLVVLTPSMTKHSNDPPKFCFISNQPRCDLTHLESKWLCWSNQSYKSL
jgi:hypothetical protein